MPPPDMQGTNVSAWRRRGEKVSQGSQSCRGAAPQQGSPTGGVHRGREGALVQTTPFTSAPRVQTLRDPHPTPCSSFKTPKTCPGISAEDAQCAAPRLTDPPGHCPPPPPPSGLFTGLRVSSGSKCCGSPRSLPPLSPMVQVPRFPRPGHGRRGDLPQEPVRTELMGATSRASLRLQAAHTGQAQVSAALDSTH